MRRDVTEGQARAVSGKSRASRGFICPDPGAAAKGGRAPCARTARSARPTATWPTSPWAASRPGPRTGPVVSLHVRERVKFEAAFCRSSGGCSGCCSCRCRMSVALPVDLPGCCSSGCSAHAGLSIRVLAHRLHHEPESQALKPEP